MEREQLLDKVLTAYHKAIEAGQAPDPAGWLARYPDLAGELATAKLLATVARAGIWSESQQWRNPLLSRLFSRFRRGTRLFWV